MNLIDLLASPDQATDYALALNVLAMITLSQFKVRGLRASSDLRA